MNSTKSTPLLKIDALNAGYGRTEVLDEISLEVHPGEIVVVGGPNGAGKSTLLNAISGLTNIYSGVILFRDITLNGLNPHVITQNGIAHCPEGRRILSRLSVEENLLVSNIDRKKTFAEKRADVFKMFPILEERRHDSAARMSGGQQQMLAIARSLMAEPDLILMDEPSLGLAPKIITQIFEQILNLAQRGISILLVEQNIRLAMEIGDYAYLFESGRCHLQGVCEEIAKSPNLEAIYLGNTGMKTD